MRVGWSNLENLVGHAAARVETGERNVELLKTAREDQRQQFPEGPEQRLPVSPGVEAVGGGAFIECADIRMQRTGVEVCGIEDRERVEKSGRLIQVCGSSTRLCCQFRKEIAADAIGVSDRTREPEVVADAQALSGQTDPALSGPVGKGRSAFLLSHISLEFRDVDTGIATSVCGVGYGPIHSVVVGRVPNSAR